MNDSGGLPPPVATAVALAGVRLPPGRMKSNVPENDTVRVWDSRQEAWRYLQKSYRFR